MGGEQARFKRACAVVEPDRRRRAASPSAKALRDPALAVGMVEAASRSRAARTPDPAAREPCGRMDREGGGVVVGMAALVGMGQHDRDRSRSANRRASRRASRRSGARPPGRRRRGEERVSRRNAGERHGGLELAGGARRRRPRRSRNPARGRIAQIARRAVGHVDDRDAGQPRQLRADADRLVVRMRDDDGDAAGADQVVRRRGSARKLCRASRGPLAWRSAPRGASNPPLRGRRPGARRRARRVARGSSRRRTRRIPPSPAAGSCGAARSRDAPGVKQKVTVTSKSASASIWRSNQSSAFGRKLSAQDRPVRR